MYREVATTVRIKLHSLTNVKERLLQREYDAFQDAVQGENDVNLYSATKQQAGKVRKQKNPRDDTEQPVVLRNDVMNVVHEPLTVADHWVKVPVYDPDAGRGSSIWCPADVPSKDHRLIEQAKHRDSELVRDGDEWYVHLVCKETYDVREQYDDRLAIDMGTRWIGVSVALSDREATFYGKEVRRVREHYKQLRKSIGKAKVRKGAQAIERIGNAESRKVDDRLHKISRQIVEDAADRNAIIVIGDLGGIREGNDLGRFTNDKVHRFPFAKPLSYIEYKARSEGIEVMVIDEAWTSQYCNRCAEKGTRSTQGLFRCSHCGLEDNADKNGALNIAKRALGKFDRPLSEAGAVLAQPITPAAAIGELRGETDAPVSPTLSEGTPRL